MSGYSYVNPTEAEDKLHVHILEEANAANIDFLPSYLFSIADAHCDSIYC